MREKPIKNSIILWYHKTMKDKTIIQLPKIQRKKFDKKKFLFLATKVKKILEEERQSYQKKIREDDEDHILSKVLY